MKRRLFQKTIAVSMAAVLFTCCLAVTDSMSAAYAAEAAPDPEMAAEPEAAADPGAETAEDPEDTAVSGLAADPGAEMAEGPTGRKAGDLAAENSAADPLGESGAESVPVTPAAGEAGEGRYVEDVFIAYGRSVEDAKEWLVANGWEPLKDKNNFNAGKNSAWDDPVAAAMGIRRTDKAEEAITDMAVMNMKGGYSIPDYESLVKEKKTEIDEFIGSFMPVIKEYRDNYNGKGSPQGKRRAKLAFELLNKFYDGGPYERYKVNDTGKPLGTLFLFPLRNEKGGEKGGDLQQIILESSGPAVLAIEQTLVLASDTAGNTWLERLSGITLRKMMDNVGAYVPEAAGQDVPYSAAGQFLDQAFRDGASKMISQWKDINEKMIWYEDFNNAHDLWQHDDESDEDYYSRYANAVEELQSDPDIAKGDIDTYYDYDTLYRGLYEVDYPGTWGDTLGDFFNPAEDNAYMYDAQNYIPLVAAMSLGQRRSLDLISLYSLVMLGLVGDEGIESLFPDVDEMLGDVMSISVYSGVNRGIFRNGVALTSRALMTKSRGYDPFNEVFDFAGAYNILCYSTAMIGIGVMAAGLTMVLRASSLKAGALKMVERNKTWLDIVNSNMEGYFQRYANVKIEWANNAVMEEIERNHLYGQVEAAKRNIEEYYNNIDLYQKKASDLEKTGSTGRMWMAIGGAILVTAAIVKGYQIYKYYQKDFTPIPTMIVDESDIVTYEEDKDGTTKKRIDFDQFVYYEAVRCNRDKKHKLSDWQDGVSDYEDWGCGDVADLNADQGQEWIALYTVKSEKKGYPILADSLIMQYGSDKQPDGTTKALHYFTFTYAADLGDTAYCYNNDKHGIYFFWDEDVHAYDVPAETASAFSSGYLAIATLGGLLVGILGTTIVLYPRRKKMMAEA